MQLIFVCSGNTCRSPLALCAWQLAVREISARGGAKRGAAFPLGQIEATSAGLCATRSAPAAPHAQTIARSWGQDLSGHGATLFCPEHAQFDLIITMTATQRDVVRAHFNIPRGQIALLGEYAPRRTQMAQAARLAPLWEDDFSPGGLDGNADCNGSEADILDPFGGSLEAYEACSTRIRRSIFELARVLSGLK